jgi:hypothetical protein
MISRCIKVGLAHIPTHIYLTVSKHIKSPAMYSTNQGTQTYLSQNYYLIIVEICIVSQGLCPVPSGLEVLLPP